MKRIFRRWLIILTAYLAGTITAFGAEIQAGLHEPVRRVTVISPCRTVSRCDSFRCSWHKICPHKCPDRYSCWSLYGAYAPYGGNRYWSSLSR